jgi:hypothetical protein
LPARLLRPHHTAGARRPTLPHLLTAGNGTVAGKSFSAELFADQLRLLNTHLRTYDKRIGDLLDAHPDAPMLRSFPGIGPLVAGTSIAEMGEDRIRYPTAAALLADTGLAPVTRASGLTRQVRFRYAAHRRMRHAIDWWTFVGHPRRHLVQNRLRRRASPRPRQVPGATRTRRPLDPYPLALLDRPHPYDLTRHHRDEAPTT